MLLNDLFEAIKPGERRAIELKIDQYEKAIRDIEQHENELDSFGGLPTVPGTENELEDLKKTYQEYINKLHAKLKDDQEKNKGKGDNFERYMKAIVKNCPTIVKTCQDTGMLLYRGTKESAPAFYGKPFDERYAKDSNSEVHQAWNKAMQEAGVVARRDNSIFTTTNKNLASNFGNQVYIVFFRDPLNFTWSDRERDLVLDTSKMADLVDPDTVRDIMSVVWANDTLREEYKNKFNDVAYRSPGSPVDFDPDKWPQNDYYEIFRKDNFTYSFRALVDIIPQLPSQYHKYAKFENWADAEEVIDNFGLHIDEDLKGAFEQRYEITIRAEYYAIRVDYEMKVREYLGMSKYSNY